MRIKNINKLFVINNNQWIKHFIIKYYTRNKIKYFSILFFQINFHIASTLNILATFIKHFFIV